MPQIKSTNKRTRYHAIVAYGKKEDIYRVFENHKEQIGAYAFVYHDKDETEPHYQMCMYTFAPIRPMTIQNWFKCETEQNCFSEPVGDLHGIVAYLTHKNEPDKHHYKETEIKGMNRERLVPSENCIDDSMDIINDIIAFTSERTLIQKYGRTYIFHRQCYHDCAKTIVLQDTHQRASFYKTVNDIKKNGIEITSEFDDYLK